MATRQEILGNIREKYPVYKDLSDDELATGIAEKYPVYAADLQIKNVPITPSITPEQQSINDFIRSSQANPLVKAVTQGGNLLNTTVVQPVEAVIGAAQGLGEVAGSPNALANLTQTGLETGGRLTFDLGNLIDNAIGKLKTSAVNDPLGTFAAASIPGALGIQQLIPHTPNQSEISQMLADQLSARQVNAVKSQPLVPEVIGNANIPLANQLETAALAAPVLPTAIRAAAAPIKTARAIGATIAPTISARMAPATVSQSAEAVFGFTPEQVQAHIPIVTQRVAELVGKVPRTADQAISYINKAEEQLYADRLQFNNAATKQGLVVRGDEAVQEAKATLDSIPNLTDAERASILDDLTNRYGGDHTPDMGQSIQQRLNKEFSAQYENGTFDKAAPLNEAKLAIRNSVADQMDQINQAITGRAETPYADIGSLIEVKGSLVDKLNKLKATEAARKTGIEATPSKIPVTKLGAATKAGRSVLTPFQKSQIEKLNANVQRIFEESPQQAPAELLNQSIVNQIRASQIPSTPNAGFEAQVQALIKTYPKNIRSNPFLSRTIAEAELGKQKFPAAP